MPIAPPAGFQPPDFTQDRQERRKRTLPVFGQSAAPLGQGGGGGDSIPALLHALELFGKITPVGLFPQFVDKIRPSRRPLEESENVQPQQASESGIPAQALAPAGGQVAQFQGDVAPKIGGPATALALANLDPAEAITNPLRTAANA